MARKKPVHHHTIVIADCEKEQDDLHPNELRDFLNNLIKKIKMDVLIEPQVQYGPFGYTGIAGIVTSHVAFHYFEADKVLQLDVYSCRKYDRDLLLKFIDSYWGVTKAHVMFIDRGTEMRLDEFEYLPNE
ncbi:MAG: S-adenosylmethionine decarboxylase [Planctomycetota bacterium]